MTRDGTSAQIRRLADAPVDDAIADLRLSVALPDGSQEEQHIRIGRPMLVDDLHICQVQNIGPIRMASVCVGDSSFQALNMALALIRDALHRAVIESKYELHYGPHNSLMTTEVLDAVLFADDYVKQSNNRVENAG